MTLTMGGEGLIAYCNASIFGLYGVLIQKRKVITYSSRKLKTYKNNYSTHDLDLIASVVVEVVVALCIWSLL